MKNMKTKQRFVGHGKTDHLSKDGSHGCEWRRYPPCGESPPSSSSLGPQSGRQGFGVVTDEASPKLAAPSGGGGGRVTSPGRCC